MTPLPGKTETLRDAAYFERNAVVLAFAHMAELTGWTVGKVADPAEPDWPVLMIDTPAGQVSWHFKADEMPATMPFYPGEWDGHDTPEKYRRLARLEHLLASDPCVAPGPTKRAFVLQAKLGWRVVRPGVPDWNARMSWHWRRRRADRVAASWNEALARPRTAGNPR